MTKPTPRQVNEAQALYHGRTVGSQSNKPSHWPATLALWALVVLMALAIWAATSCTPAHGEAPVDADLQAMQAAINKQCATGTDEQRLSCAIDVVQAQNPQQWTPADAARAKAAAGLAAKAAQR